MKSKMNKTQTPDGVETLNAIPRGKPKSGRPWKSVKSRFSTMTIDKTSRSSWQKKMALKAELKSVQKFSNELKEQRAKEKQLKRERTEENKRRRLENEKKSEVVQTIKNTAKIKRMKKKQLRQIQKR